MLDQKILTTRGIIDASKLLPGDYVYEYKTSIPLEVRHIETKRDEKIFKVKYSDKRIENYGMGEKIFFNGEIRSLTDLSNNVIKCAPIKRTSIDYKKIYTPLPIDPYTIGALYAYSEPDDPYVFIPYKSHKALEHILHVNGWEVYSDPDASEMYDADKIYFTEIGNKERIKWSDIFPYELDHNNIPNDYIFGSIIDRVKLIRGIFDTGYDLSITPDTISIRMLDHNKLKIIQNVLWSLGIMSFIFYDKYIFQLNILGSEQDYPGLFYDINNRSRMINTDNVVYKCDPLFELYISSVFPVYGKNDIWYYIELEKPQAIYYSDKYLPRVSE